MRAAYLCADPGIPVFGSKGCSIHVQEFLRALLARRMDVTLLAARKENVRALDLGSVDVEHIPVARSREPLKREQEAFRSNEVYLSALRCCSPFDLVYERYSLWSYAGMAYALEAGIPGILEVNAPLIDEQANHRSLVDRELAESVVRRCFRDATRIVAVSRGVADWIHRYPEASGKVVVVPNGVDTNRFDPGVWPAIRRPDTFTVGFLGSLKPWHGVDTLADAFVALKRRLPNAQLLVVGDGPVKGSLLEQLHDAGVMDSCRFTGKVPADQVPSLLASMDVGVAPAAPAAPAEDYFSPLKVFEYMAMELPVVCSRSGQMRDLIEDGRNGLLFTPGSATELTTQLMSLSADPDRRRRLGKEGRRTVVDHHTWGAVVNSVLRTISVAPHLSAAN